MTYWPVENALTPECSQVGVLTSFNVKQERGFYEEIRQQLYAIRL
jgi:hypothetical protein